ncbi:MAG: hypothetical protein J0I06_05060 [Planctomycetes bacterium]|nr:hypothetical protein [Planctomycetota bacterium]
MPVFLADPPQWLYLLLGGCLVVTGALAAQKQDRRAAFPFGIAALLLLLVFLLDRFFESPREEAVRRTFMMGLAADAKNPDAFAEHVADKVSVQTGKDQTKTATRDELKKSQFWGMLKQFNVSVTTSGYSRDDVNVIDDNTIEIGFIAKGEAKGFAEGKAIPIYCRATFGRQSDGSFKLTAFKAFEFINRNEPFIIPNFP